MEQKRQADGNAAISGAGITSLPIDDGGTARMDTAEILRLAQDVNRSYLMEHESKRILEDAGIKTTGGMVASSEDEAVETAMSIGYPIVLKIVSPRVVHKTDSGGVKLNLRNDAEVREAYRDILSRFKNEKIMGVSVQKMAPPGMEAIVGVARDESFGPVLMFGLGGIFAEVIKDVAFRVLPITEDTAAELIEEIKGYSLLRGYRGHSVDILALKRMLLRVSNLAIMHPEIRELDLNPVLLYPSGYLAVDARIFVDYAPREPVGKAPPAEDNLFELFYPQSIAILGATDAQGKLGYNVMQNLLSHQFAGKLYPINPRKETVLGVKAYGSILEVEEPVMQRSSSFLPGRCPGPSRIAATKASNISSWRRQASRKPERPAGRSRRASKN